MDMKVYVAKTPIGIFALSENGEVLKHDLYKDPEEALSFVNMPIPDDFLSSLKGDIVQGEKADQIARKHFRKIALERFSKEQLNEFISGFAIYLSRKNMQGAIETDKFLVQASNALEDLKSIENLLLERFTEWYRLHYPESKITHRELLNYVLKYGRREKFPDFERSIGIDISEEDEKIILDYAGMIQNVIDQRKRKEDYLRNRVPEILQNLCSIVDPLLAARLVAAAGSLEKLAKMASSTIQLLGAEKALFRHLKKKGKAPKYGILFNDNRISSAPESKRGKIARIISAKLAVAARVDYYSKRLEGRLRNDLENELRKVMA